MITAPGLWGPNTYGGVCASARGALLGTRSAAPPLWWVLGRSTLACFPDLAEKAQDPGVRRSEDTNRAALFWGQALPGYSPFRAALLAPRALDERRSLVIRSFLPSRQFVSTKACAHRMRKRCPGTHYAFPPGLNTAVGGAARSGSDVVIVDALVRVGGLMNGAVVTVCVDRCRTSPYVYILHQYWLLFARISETLRHIMG